MIASVSHSQGQIVWPKQQHSCRLGQPIELRSNKVRQPRACQQRRYSLNASALLHTAERDIHNAVTHNSGRSLHGDTIAAIVTGELIVLPLHHSRPVAMPTHESFSCVHGMLSFSDNAVAQRQCCCLCSKPLLSVRKDTATSCSTLAAIMMAACQVKCSP